MKTHNHLKLKANHAAQPKPKVRSGQLEANSICFLQLSSQVKLYFEAHEFFSKVTPVYYYHALLQ